MAIGRKLADIGRMRLCSSLPGYLAVAMVCLISSANSAEASSGEFPEPIDLGGGPLVLNGQATRSVFGVRVYDAGLYVSHATDDGAAIMERNMGPKRLKIILRRAVPSDKFSSSVRDNLDRNLTPAEQAVFADHLAAFFKSLKIGTDLNRGTEVTIDYLPGEGTVVMVNGQRRAVIPGHDFYHALLRLWIGKPLQSSMKTGLLGKGKLK